MPSARIIKALLCGALFVSPLGASARWVVVEPGSTNAAVILTIREHVRTFREPF
jgi:hypothetical protein